MINFIIGAIVGGTVTLIVMCCLIVGGRADKTASEGMILTDGKNFARVTRLAEGVDPAEWYEITEAEYEQIMAEQEAEAQKNLM